MPARGAPAQRNYVVVIYFHTQMKCDSERISPRQLRQEIGPFPNPLDLPLQWQLHKHYSQRKT